MSKFLTISGLVILAVLAIPLFLIINFWSWSFVIYDWVHYFSATIPWLQGVTMNMVRIYVLLMGLVSTLLLGGLQMSVQTIKGEVRESGMSNSLSSIGGMLLMPYIAWVLVWFIAWVFAL